MSQDVSRMRELLEKGLFKLDNDEVRELATLYANRVSWLLECEERVLEQEQTSQRKAS